ncbi:putative proton-dependent oligopeptide transporter family, major facilitator superfamily [Rosa chinensis]|uniref:Putative proton-dependent oligopeptide transporter family, major facilitator superfamily n=1 Tax=Rosa chinensis TaxID=74649 RepID=A0A2P6R384_ROSCH|nr:protein NRT1/ PTR FAMILY 2.13 [Rosa chinensis]PRQ40874.1 putative proton-dependent oligopeptide transporter family, major facilitator superfamily [Rosa chinensis]
MVWERIRSPNFFSSFCCCFRSKPRAHSSPSSSEALLLLQREVDDVVVTRPGWKAMPYILGNEAIEKMATFGLTTNLMVYLVREYHMDQVFAANLLALWTCAYCLFTVLGASLADTYLGKFRTILFASFASLLGMVTITVTAFVPLLRPPPCDLPQHCISNTKTQLWILIMGLSWLGIGGAGIRPCSLPFGIDQFDSSTVEGRLAIHSFLNWYYTSATLVVLINLVFVVYIQDSVSWALGFGIPTLLMMLCAIPLFLVGSNIYVRVKPEGSMFLSFAQVLVAAYKKRHLKLLNDERVQGVLFDASLDGNAVVSKLPLSTQSSFLKKAALVVDNELKEDGFSANVWRLCTMQQVEDVICVLKTLPIWASGGIFLIPFVEEGTFMVSQALKMDRHIGTKFQMPAGSIKIISLSIVIIWLPLYDCVIQPALKKITKYEDGIPTLKRIGMGYVFSILCMLVAGLVEQQRRALATLHGESLNGVAPMSVFWLFPQLMLLGLSEVFGALGHIEFYNREFPEKMKSIGNSLIYLCMAGATYLSSLVVTFVHSVTGKYGQSNWLDNDINAGRLDFFYFLIAGLGVLNFVYFVFCACGYTHKASVKAVEIVPDV